MIEEYKDYYLDVEDDNEIVQRGKYCNELITFNESKRSSSGKIIPLNFRDLSVAVASSVII
ncbi:MAG: hypothetical protein WBX01_11215 [Nitrososphaeraceae archaeon]